MDKYLRDIIEENKTLFFENESMQGNDYYQIVKIPKSERVYIIRDEEDIRVADHIFISAMKKELNPYYNRFKGFGGSTLKFNLFKMPDISKAVADGKGRMNIAPGVSIDFNEQIAYVTAPWNTNPKDLLLETGINVMHKVWSRMTISIDYDFDNEKFVDIIHYEDTWKQGTFQRDDEVLRKLFNEDGCDDYYKLYVYQQTAGGGYRGYRKREDYI